MNRFTTLSQVAHVLGCSIDPDRPISNACVDSRLLQAGDLFFALGGEQTDGHQFLDEAAKKGAAAAVVNKNYQGPDHGLPLLRVIHPLQSLQQLAKTSLEKFSGKIVGITGSLGKTTTREFLYTLLKEKFKVSRTPENYNTQIGLPLTLLNHVCGDEAVVILEMAMTEKGQIKRLIEIAPPDIAIITKIDLAHAQNFNSIDEIAETKGEILTHTKTQLGIVPPDFPDIGSCPKKRISAFDLPESFPFPGAHHKYNFAIAATCAEVLGMSRSEIFNAIPKLMLPERRFEAVEKHGVLFINDSYNATVSSIEAALQSLPRPKDRGRRIAVLTALVEMGQFTEECHQQVAQLSLKYIDELFCLGEGCETIVNQWKEHKKPVFWFQERTEVVQSLQKQIQPGDVVLLKGANNKQLWKVLEEI